MIKKIFYWTLIVLGFLGILDTIFVIPVSSGIGYGTLMPAGIGIALIVFAVLKLRSKGPIIKNKTWRIIVTAVLAVGIFVFAATEALLVGTAMTYKSPPKEKNYVVVLGCGIFSDGRLTLTLKNRLDAAIEYLDTYPNALCIVSGGQGPQEPTTEAYAMEQYLISQDVAPGRILLEDRSTSTNENLTYSLAVMELYDPTKEKSAAIVTNDFHIFRATMLARHHGIDAIGITCPTPWYIRLNCYLREFLALFKTLIIDMR